MGDSGKKVVGIGKLFIYAYAAGAVVKKRVDEMNELVGKVERYKFVYTLREYVYFVYIVNSHSKALVSCFMFMFSDIAQAGTQSVALCRRFYCSVSMSSLVCIEEKYHF